MPRIKDEDISDAENRGRDKSPVREKGRIFFSTNKNIFSSWIEVLKNYREETLVRFSCNGLSVQTMDAAHISYSDTVLYPNSFSIYKVNMDKTLGLKLEMIHKILSDVSTGDRITFECTEEDLASTSPHATLTVFSSAKYSKPTKQAPDSVQIELEKEIKFNLRLLDIEPNTVAPNTVEIGAEVTVGSENFFTIVRQMASKADVTRFIVTPLAIVFKVEEDLGGIELTLKSTTADGLYQRCNINCEEGLTFKLMFALLFLNRLSPISKIAPLIKLILPKDAGDEKSPLRVTCSIVDSATKTECGVFRFYLAQQIDD